MIKEGKANVIIDGQWGSTGKGKLAGWLYNNYKIDVAICDFMPNAGHTYVDNYNIPHILTQLPIGALFSNTKKVLIGPHAVINKNILMREIENIPDIEHKLVIHPLASIVSWKDRREEEIGQKRIASTMKGSMAATIKKMKRGEVKFKDANECMRLCPFIGDTYEEAQKSLDRNETILIETSQGFDLGLNQGQYPYVTSRDCLAGRALDNAGISPRQLGSIIASLRTYPIRVGNVDNNSSGPCYSDQKEISWEEISREIGEEVKEYTTITKRVRRVFTFSFLQLERFLRIVRPHFAFINFCNYLTKEKGINFLRRVEEVMKKYECELKLFGTSAANYDMIVNNDNLLKG